VEKDCNVGQVTDENTALASCLLPKATNSKNSIICNI